MSLADQLPAPLLKRLCLDAIELALGAPTHYAVNAIEDYSARQILDTAERFGAVAAITIGRARASALRARTLELTDMTLAHIEAPLGTRRVVLNTLDA
jgi:hypothetical protein